MTAQRHTAVWQYILTHPGLVDREQVANACGITPGGAGQILVTIHSLYPQVLEHPRRGLWVSRPELFGKQPPPNGDRPPATPGPPTAPASRPAAPAPDPPPEVDYWVKAAPPQPPRQPGKPAVPTCLPDGYSPARVTLTLIHDWTTGPKHWFYGKDQAGQLVVLRWDADIADPTP